MSVGTLVTLNQVAWSADSKRRLWQQTQADLCDMETHAVAQACVDHNVPWVGGRVVSDAADQTLQPWMLALPSLIQQARWSRLCGQLLTHPQDLPGLLRLALRMQQLKRHLTHFTIELVTHVLPA
ncbi:MAG: hypothetical protein IT423_17970 [Pirellulaceae bacterium]|nr:hypothetical protein [Pirellulaceae bacterium]